MIPLDILYQDDWLVAVGKPAGLLVHRSMIDPHETRFALQQVRDQIGQRVYPIHRLDKPTSGVLVFALDPDTARRMTDRFTAAAIGKHYLAVVRGHSAEHDLIDYPLKEPWDKMTDTRADPDKPAQPAITAYRRLATAELPHPVGRYATARYSLLELEPQTGRKHQIRRHMKHVFHPVIGDTSYGDGRHNRFFRQQLGCRRLLLAATELRFAHPHTAAKVAIQAPLATDFQQVIQALGWTDATSGRPA